MQTVIPYKNNRESKKKQIEQMFDQIAYRYDFLNHFLSMGIDRIWRKKAIRMVSNKKPLHILDIATGTGDFAIEALVLKPELIQGIDISEEMLTIGRKKIEKRGLQNQIVLSKGDSESIPFKNESFDLVTVAFGVRNFENLEQGIAEIFRVLKNNGEILVLEFSKPRKFPIKQLYRLYFNIILPFIGRLFSGSKEAYSYLPESAYAFPDNEAFVEVLRKSGFQNPGFRNLSFGVATIYIAQKRVFDN